MGREGGLSFGAAAGSPVLLAGGFPVVRLVLRGGVGVGGGGLVDGIPSLLCSGGVGRPGRPRDGSFRLVGGGGSGLCGRESGPVSGGETLGRVGEIRPLSASNVSSAVVASGDRLILFPLFL